MKSYINNILLVSLGIFLFCSCSSDNAADGQDGEPIAIRLSAVQQMPQPVVKSATSPMPKDYAVGVFITEDNVSQASIGSNLPYKTDASGKLILQDEDLTPYYPLWASEVEITAYHPYDMAISSNYTFEVKKNQTEDSDYQASDLLYVLGKYRCQSDSHALLFKHKLSHITCTLTGTGADISKASVRLLNLYTSVTFNYLTGDVKTQETNVEKRIITPNSEGAVVPPQTISGYLLEIKAGDKTYYYKPDKAIDLKAGESLDLTIDVGVRLGVNYQINDWTDGLNGTDGNITPLEAVYHVGDYYPDPYVVYKDKKLVSGTPAIGVVFWVDPTSAGKHGKVVALDETFLSWGVFEVDESKGDPSSPIRSLDNGQAATRYLIGERKDQDNFDTDYAAFNYVYETKNNRDIDGVWYLPALNELQALYDVYAIDKAAFKEKLSSTVDGVNFRPDSYWTSSEGDSIFACLVDFFNGSQCPYPKDFAYSVRCVLAF